MYKLIPEALSLKTYWCADFQVASHVAEEIADRYGCSCAIVHVPAKSCWRSADVQRSKTFTLRDNIGFSCSQEQVRDGLHHAKSDIVKIADTSEIFCFTADDPFWQHLHDPTC